MSTLAEALNSDWLKDHQTFVASLAALAGLVGGWLVTGLINRRHADRIRHQEATSLAAILAAEVHAMRHQARMLVVLMNGLEKYTNDRQRSPDSSCDPLTISYARPRVFDKVAEKIGLLGPQLSFKVAGFYFLFFDVLGSLEAIPKEELTDFKLLQLIKAYRGGLQQVWERGTQLLPDLIAFAHSEKRPKTTSDWLSDDAAALERRVKSGQSNFDPANPFAPLGPDLSGPQ
ncbi:MAG: hypothetical protein QOH65_3466 [Methylobacteriaceae bacterium]|jgi:hypothetical protein|nr:hypothetical protein [Methylobacteriaceae bacterium]